MKNPSHWAAVAVLPIALSACAGYELQNSKNLKAPADSFFQTAYAGYLNRAEHETSYGSYPSADAFAIKARQAAAGTVPVPFTVNDNAAPAGTVAPALVAELNQARANVVNMLAGPDRALVPGAAAQALVMYDCWLEEESYIGTAEQVYQADHAAYCKAMYVAAMAEIDRARPRPVAAVVPPPAPMAAAPQQVAATTPAVTGNYLVFFDWDKATLTPQGRDVIRQAAANAKIGKINRIVSTGHADTSGTAAYNVDLSKERAEALRAALIAEGIPGANIGTEWKGEAEPMVATADGVREAQNRRVEIVFVR